MTDYVSDVAHHYEADPELTTRIINQMKSKGYFDQLRKEILADIDTKPAYQNMRQRVENAVNRYLKGQKWSNELVKNKLRDNLRRHLIEGRLIHVGPVLNQVLTPDVCSQIAPEVDKQICQELGIPEDEEMPEEDDTTDNHRRDGDFDGPGGSSNGPRSFEPSYGGGRHNGRAWGHENDFFYPYSGGYNRFSRRCENRDSGSSDEDEDKKKTPEKIPVNNMSQFDEMELEYSKKEVVELERKENPEEATKLALEQLAAQKFKIEQELQRMELEEQNRAAEAELQRRREIEVQQQRELEDQRQRELEERQRAELEDRLKAEMEEKQSQEAEQLLQDQKLKEETMEEADEELEEPKTPEMSDGEDSDTPELQVAVEDFCQVSTDSGDAAKPAEEAEPVEEVKPSMPVEFVEPEKPVEPKVEEPTSVPESTMDAVAKSEPVKASGELSPPVEFAKEPEKVKEKNVEEPKKRTEERSKSRDERHKSEHRKEHSSSSNNSSKRHHSSSSSSKSSSHKSSSSSRRDSTSKHSSSSSSSKSKEDSKSSSHSSSRTSSRRDSEKHKSSSSSSSSRHRKDDKHRSSKSSSSSSSHKKGEDSNNLYYFTPEQSIEAVRSRIHLDEVMIRLEAENSGYDSLISDSETEDTPANYEIELDNSDAIKVEELLGIQIEGVDREAISAQNSSLEEINANEIIKTPPTVNKLHLKRHITNGTWDHSEPDANYLSEETPSKKVLSVVLEKCTELETRSNESNVPVLQQAPPPKRKRIVRKVEQRYSTDDLYKPRTTFTSSRRSRE